VAGAGAGRPAQENPIVPNLKRTSSRKKPKTKNSAAIRPKRQIIKLNQRSKALLILCSETDFRRRDGEIGGSCDPQVYFLQESKCC
jgi:hypothetical protein